MTAEGRGATADDVPKDAPLLARERTSPAIEQRRSVLPEDAGHFGPTRGHQCGECPPIALRRSADSVFSLSVFVATCR